jgi:hypothetical protein
MSNNTRYKEAQRKSTFINSRPMSVIKQSGEPFAKPLIVGYLTPVQIKELPKDSNAEILIDVEKRAQTKLALVLGFR